MRELENFEAAAIIETTWEQVADVFRREGFPQPAQARLEVASDAHDSCRHYAATSVDARIVVFAPEIVLLPAGSIEAIMAHEAGHVVDFSNPGRFWYRNDALVVQETLPSRGLKRLFSAWIDRSRDEQERVADAIAEHVMEYRIGYVGPCMIQDINRGQHRPRGLR
jgi:hypothetical protein